MMQLLHSLQVEIGQRLEITFEAVNNGFVIRFSPGRIGHLKTKMKKVQILAIQDCGNLFVPRSGVIFLKGKVSNY